LRRAIRPTLTVLTAAALTLALFPASASAADSNEDPKPTSTITGTVTFRNGGVVKGVYVNYRNVDCTPAHKTISDPYHSDDAKVNKSGTFTFKAYADQCYRLDVEGSFGIRHYGISLAGAKFAEDVYVAAGSKVDLRLNARPATVTVKNAATRSTIKVYQRNSGSWSRVFTDSSAYKGAVDFHAVPGKRYTVNYNADAESSPAYNQTWGGDPRSPASADNASIKSFKIKAGSSTFKKSIKLVPARPGAIFTPRMELVSGSEYVVGATLRASGPAKGWRVSYAWYAGGQQVGSGSTYTLHASDAGSRIFCEVTAWKVTYQTVTKRTGSATVLKLPSTLDLTLAQSSVSRGSRGQVTASVHIAGVGNPDGKIRLRVAGRTLTENLRSYDGSTIIFTLPALRSGTYTVTGEFYNSSYARPSKATSVTFSVR
jgi:hypothetical protein